MKLFFAGLALVVFMTAESHAGSRDAQWRGVEEAIRKGLPRTAITNLEPIIRAALQDRAWAEATKAIGRRAMLESAIQGHKPEERIRLIEKEIAAAPPQIVPMLDTIIGHWYWDYFRQNRWRFMRRTATAHAPSDDFTTWDLPRLFARIDDQFTKALAAHEILKSTPVNEWDDLLEQGTVPDAYRPTLYDFVAHEALQFYTSGEQAAAQPEEPFGIGADSPIFDPADRFMAWDPAAGSSMNARRSPLLKAIRLYQDLLRFHGSDADPSARLDVDLARLTWGANVATGEDKNTRYQAALQRLAQSEGDHELAATALHRLAEALRKDGNLVEARRVALRGQQSHPQSTGGKLCANLVAEIESRSANIVTERLWSRPWPGIRVRYRNVTNVWLRLVPWNWDEFLERRRHRPEALDDKERAAVLAKKPAYEWSSALPATTNYQTAVFEVSPPDDVQPGFYFLVASHTPDFTEGDNQLSMTDLWVSDLTFVVRSRDSRVEGFVLEAASGEPIQGAKVEGWYLDQSRNRVRIGPVQTDTNGLFVLKTTLKRSLLLKVTARGQTVASSPEYAAEWNQQKEQPFERTVFFTDRALYRPGQTIQYKGICLRVNREQDNYQTLQDVEVVVVLFDPNGKEVERQSHRANAYGSFSGSFTAPAGRVTGQMRIEVAGGPPGMTLVSVEEYKRPKFQVAIDAPKVAARLNDTVRITGHATSYTGAAVDGAQVKYRVVREVRMPWWWDAFARWPSPWLRSPSQEIAHGSILTGVDGTFTLEFPASPDRRVPEKDDPRFVFAVHADVTDSAGETRSAHRTIWVGYTALDARVMVSDWQTEDRPVELGLRTTTLDDEPQSAEGIVRIHALEAPAKVRRPSMFGSFADDLVQTNEDGRSDLSRLDTWPVGSMVFERGFTTETNGSTRVHASLPAGAYRVVVETQDRFGKRVKAMCSLYVARPQDTRLLIPLPFYLGAPKWEVEPGEDFVAYWGTGYESGRAFVEIERRGRLLQSYWTRTGETQARITQAVSETMRGGFDLRVTFVRENRAYLESKHVTVPWTNKELKLRWEHFTSKLEPNTKETWTVVVEAAAGKAGSPEPAEGVVAEMVAALYDRSLDQFKSFSWPYDFGVFAQDIRYLQQHFGNEARQLQTFRYGWNVPHQPVSIRYRALPQDIVSGWPNAEMRFMRDRLPERAGRASAPTSAQMPVPPSAVVSEESVSLANALRGPAPSAPAEALALAKATGRSAAGSETGQPTASAESTQRLDVIVARRNLAETAFFFPHLVSNTNGQVRITFTVPEALTEWRFLGFAHDSALRAGRLEDSAVTAKELMVQPNPPRFLREGDILEFSVKVLNQSDTRQQGTVRLSLADAWSGDSADAKLGNTTPDRAFDLPPKQSGSFAWQLRIPDGLTSLSYKAVASAAKLSDGEEAMLPVLTRRVVVTESLPLPVRGPVTRKFEFKKLAESGRSATLQHQSLTVQMVSNPAWYAVMALPYLIEFPYECSEQVFNRYYANALARFIARSNPKVRRVFDLWKNTPALDSPLEKNRDLKNITLEESPWLRQAQSESQARRNVGIMFDENRLDSELARALDTLSQAQLADGAWSWFPGGRPNDYITLYIATGFGRLRQLGVDPNIQPALRALARLDNWISLIHQDILRHETANENHLSPTIALYLYGRSFFLKERPIAPATRPAIDFFLAQAAAHWPDLSERQSQAHLALALNRFGDAATAKAIVRSLKERSVTDGELGRFWRDAELSWWWYRAPTETQALMIEAFAEVTKDTEAVEECKLWLLKQKQTQDWRTTKATADAVYALLLRGRDLLADDRLVEVSLGDLNLTPAAQAHTDQGTGVAANVEPGTGFYERRFVGSEVRSEMSRVAVRKDGEGIAWGSVHWQYFEDMAKVAPYAGTPLRLKKSLFTKVSTSGGRVLQPVSGPLSVGDELVIRIELRTDRDMEYVHLKDQRGSGTEPLNVLSGYRFQDGLAYYESTRDTASHFFIDYLPKGTYVFEYSTRVQHRGEYQSGVALIECLYAPEFNSHSESLLLKVR